MRAVLTDEWGEVGERRVSINASGSPWASVVDDLCQQAEVGVVVPAGTAVAGEDAGPTLVTMKIWEVPLRTALERVGALRGLEPIYDGGMVHFETVGVRAIGVVDPGYLSPEEAQAIVKAASPADTAINAAGPNVVVAGNNEVVDRGDKLAEVFSKIEPGQWLCSVYVLEISRTMRDRLGLEISLGGAVHGVLSSNTSTAIARVLLDGTIRGEHRRSLGQVLNHASVMVIEGKATKIRNVTTIPVVRRSVNGATGTVTESGFDFVEAGLILELSVRRVPGGRVWLEAKPEVSGVTGFVSDAPIVSRRSMEFATMVRPGDYVYVAGLDQVRESESHDGLFETSHGSETDGSAAIVLIRLAALEAGAVVDEPPQIERTE